MNLAARILAAKLPHKDEKVKEWGCTVRVQTLSTRDRVELWDAIMINQRAIEQAEADGIDAPARLDDSIMQLIFALRDPKTGDRIFKVEQHDDLMGVSYTTIERLLSVFLALNMQAAIEDIETLKKSSI